MGCGGSRADAIEPRYYESWTRETESTWLTNTDAEPQQPLPNGGPESGNAEAGLRETGILEDGKYSQTCVTKSSVASGIPTAEKRTHCGTQCTKPVSHTTGTSAPKQQNGFRTAEPKWDSKKKATKETTINAAKSNRQMNSNRRVTKNCVN
ncbi:PREDICTED: brain and acute leukemia cytoplasmic protein [Gekko japonicus]|uniref:Brain and acute leukemia cytoplasmic protein n=1 Tax=Gekko japonicus TaxID=146911 RepID=A0ABM1LCL1_GEKJA|nr:PREDICTED: brain and acute leukemia cytoplasmic protein [Gekko japonicus]